MNKEELIAGLEKGDVRTLSRAITMAESTRKEKRNVILEVIQHFGPKKDSYRIGITGTPGAGKSTFIEAAGAELLKDKKRKLAVLSIDPSSEKTHGSILGDKTRMTTLSNHERAFIRSTSSGAQLGGLAKNTRLAMLLCEAAGYNTILIESVGVGQGETEIAQLADLFTLVITPGGGDELQGIKRGIMEMADIIVVNKADGDAKNQANLTAKEYSMALHLKPENENGWVPKVITASALEGQGIEAYWKRVFAFEEQVIQNQWKASNRNIQMKYWAKKSIQDLLLARLGNYQEAIEQGISEGKLPEVLAQDIVNG